MGQPNKQSPEEIEAAMHDFADSSWCDNILIEIEEIFDNEGLSIDERKLKIDRRKSAYQALKATIDGKYTEPFIRKGQSIFLSLKSLSKIVAVCNASTEELERLKSIPKESKPVAFRDYLNVKENHKDEIIQILHTLRKNGKGRTLALMIHTLEETGLLLPYDSLRQLFRSMQSTFTNPGELTGFQDRYREIARNKDAKTCTTMDQYRKQLLPFFSKLT